MKYKRKTAACLFFIFISATSIFAEETKDYSKSLSLQGATFNLKATKLGSINNLNILAEYSGHKIFEINREIEGTLQAAEVADLNSDGSPEIYIYLTSAGSGSYGSLVAYAVNKKKSLSEIFLPDIMADSKLSKGYRGHDEFSVVENSLARRFPLYKDGDMNSKPTGGMRQVEYKLMPGEAGWVLRVKNSTDFK
jgi:hypothetical protein